VLLAVVIIGGLLLSLLTALVDALRWPSRAYTWAARSKAGTVIGIVLTGGVGGLYYWAFVRRDVKQGASEAPTPPELPKPDLWADDDAW
jgi:hypothetical protein